MDIKEIKDLCNRQSMCYMCPLSNEEGLCLLRQCVPEYWNIERIEKLLKEEG